MQAEHLVSQCIWESQLDTQEQARALQEALSQWSKTILQDELTQFFDQQCPATQIWRIERLQLDLGDIAYQDLLSELPKRLRASLHEEFARLHTHQQINKLRLRRHRVLFKYPCDSVLTLRLRESRGLLLLS